MKIIIFLAAFTLCSHDLNAQKSDTASKDHLPALHISVNPLNILFFQQAGITYEFKPGRFGFGITAGYIYPNNKEYSNWFIAGPVKYGSLGYYSGFFLVPQVNVYLSKPKKTSNTPLVYLSGKVVYKYMTIDSIHSYAWYTYTSGDYYWTYRKQVDRVNIIGGFAIFGLKYVWKYFFFDINIGPGIMFVNHNLVIAGETYGLNHHSDISNVHPPRSETLNEIHGTIHFSLNLGIPF